MAPIKSFLIPIIAWLPPEYDLTVVMPDQALGGCLEGGKGLVRRVWQVRQDDTIVDEGDDLLRFEDGELVDGPPAQLRWRGSERSEISGDGGYLEYAVSAGDGDTWFRREQLPSFYNVYSSPTRKSFFACHTPKFGSRLVINQIATFGKYVDAYPVIHFDRERDFGDSLMLINPYDKPILARLHAQVDRKIPRVKVPAHSVRAMRLADMIGPDLPSWNGQVQLSANNRLVTYVVKHKLSDPQVLASAEHLDPYRADRTHAPLSKWLRHRIGIWRRRRDGLRKPRPA